MYQGRPYHSCPFFSSGIFKSSGQICRKPQIEVRRFSISARGIRKRNQYNPIALLIHLTVQGQAGFEWDFLAGICGGTWKAQLCQEGFPLPVRKPPDCSPPQEPPCTHCTESKYRTLWGNTTSWNPPPSRSSLAYSGGSTALLTAYTTWGCPTVQILQFF